MMDTTSSHSHDTINAIFAQLDRRDVEQFYASYQLWLLQQHIAEVQARIQSVTQQIAENQERLQRVHPSAIALATLARLQSNGVNDIDLLDRMLARGESWLDCTMQRLAYCEKFDFIRDNYTDWCEHALEGAYDWIDSVDEARIENSSSPEDASGHNNTLSDASVDAHADAQSQTTEEMLLLKLMSDEDEALMQAPTLKIAALPPVKPPADVEPTVLEREQQALPGHTPSPVLADHNPSTEEVIPPKSNETGRALVEQPADFVEPIQAEYFSHDDVQTTGNAEVAEPITTSTTDEMDASSHSRTASVLIEQEVTPEARQQSSSHSTPTQRKRSFLRRLIAAFLGI